MTDLIDTRLGQYHLTEVIGRGGMSVVYKAYQPTLDRFVAVKVLLHNRDPQFAARFKREARAIAHLQHPNILPIYDYNEQDGLFYLILQHIENGTTLSDLLGTPMAPAAALRLMTHLLAALDYAHTRGVIHRDIKPSNILMLSPRWPMLADFGIAKLLTDNQRLTMSGMIMGTAAYMAPEQAIGRPIDARTDLYAAGIVLYELLTGRVPFEADTPIAVLMKQAYEPPPPPRSLNPDLPASVEAALLRALEKEPNARYQSAAAMAEELERVAIQIERSATRDQLAGLYQTGVQALKAERWDVAVEQFSRLVALDPSYRDAAELLEAAQAAPVRGRQETLRRTEGVTEKLDREAPAGPPALPHCPKCGQEVRPDWADCPACHTPLAIAMEQLGQEDSPPRAARRAWLSPRIWWIGVPLLIALAVLAGRIWFARQNGPGPPPQTLVTDSTAFSGAIVQTTPTGTPSPIPTPTPTNTPLPTASASLAPATPTLEPSSDALVDIPQLNLRGGPDTKFPSLGLYNQGTALRVIGKEPARAWLQVQTPDNRVGWMFAANLHVNIPLADVPVVATPPTPTSPPPKPTNPRPTPTAKPPIETPTAPPPTVPPPTDTPTNTLTPTHKRDGGCGGNCPPPTP